MTGRDKAQGGRRLDLGRGKSRMLESQTQEDLEYFNQDYKSLCAQKMN